jgi:hypothetical protein
MNDPALMTTNPQMLLLLLGCVFALVVGWVLIAVSETPLAESEEKAGARAPLPDPVTELQFDVPERCAQPIGRYMDATIFESAFIEGVEYRFDRVLPPRVTWLRTERERCVAPGLVYVRA